MTPKGGLIAFVALTVHALVAAAFSLRGYSQKSARDFEECVEALGASPSDSRSSPSLGGEPGIAMTSCNARFAGRRKPRGGGYGSYDFMDADPPY
jgi:hypothetical protein